MFNFCNVWLGRSATPCSNRANQDLGRNSESLMEAADHLERKRTLAVHNLMNPTAPADDSDQSVRIQSLLFESKSNRFDRVRRIDWEMFLFVRFNQRGEDIELVPVGGPDFCTP